MTLREVDVAFRAIMKRKKEEREWQARCLGAEIQKEETKDFLTADEVTKAQNDAMMKAVEEKMKQKGLRQWQT